MTTNRRLATGRASPLSLAGAFPVLAFPLPFALQNPRGELYNLDIPRTGLRFISGCPDHPLVEALDPKKIPMRTA
jgi:hypothetical protein